MDALYAMKNRRSVRAYRKEQIRDDQLNAILEAGTYAPTGMGKQSPIMVVVQDPDLIAKLSRMNAAVMGMDGDPFYGAPTVVIVFGNPSAARVNTHQQRPKRSIKKTASLTTAQQQGGLVRSLSSCLIPGAARRASAGTGMNEGAHLQGPVATTTTLCV